MLMYKFEPLEIYRQCIPFPVMITDIHSIVFYHSVITLHDWCIQPFTVAVWNMKIWSYIQ